MPSSRSLLAPAFLFLLAAGTAAQLHATVSDVRIVNKTGKDLRISLRDVSRGNRLYEEDKVVMVDATAPGNARSIAYTDAQKGFLPIPAGKNFKLSVYNTKLKNDERFYLVVAPAAEDKALPTIEVALKMGPVEAGSKKIRLFGDGTQPETDLVAFGDKDGVAIVTIGKAD